VHGEQAAGCRVRSVSDMALLEYPGGERTGATVPAGMRVLLIVPCYNEEGSVGELLDELNGLKLGCDSLVIDDGSTDRTYEIAYSRAKVVRLVHNLGIGGAVQTGIKFAARGNYDFCIQIDGDGQHPPSHVVGLLNAYRTKPANLIVGSRYAGGRAAGSTLTRRLGSRLIGLALRVLFRGQPLTDPTSGMRLMDRKAIAHFAHHYPQDFPEPISLAWALRSGLTVSESPVQMRSRRVRTSSINGLKPLAYMVRVLGYILMARIASTDPSPAKE
jgi:glycosyltransferase involved in cell wall biosynthesis